MKKSIMNIMNTLVKTVVITIIITLIAIFLLSRVKLLSTEMSQSYYVLMKRVTDILIQNNIPYFIIGGTLLGSMREGEMIAWDDDIDIGIFEEDLPRFLAIDFSNDGLQHRGVELQNIGKIFYKDYKDNGKKMESVFVDIFIYRKEGDRYVFTHDYSRNTWPDHYFREDELFPLKLYKFGDIEVYGPNIGENVLEREYGNWKRPPYRKEYGAYMLRKNFWLTVFVIFFFVFLCVLCVLCIYFVFKSNFFRNSLT